MPFTDRTEAGRRLADRLGHLRDPRPVVLGLPRGGVPVAAGVARALDADLDVIVVRKLGVPSQPELGLGAIGEDGVRIINDEVVRASRVSERQIAAVEEQERAELERRAARFRRGRERIDLSGRMAIVVDDGIATGSTARAACQVAREHGAARVVLAVPVAPPGWTHRLADAADELVALEEPDPFFAIGQFYEDFSQTTDDEVVALLEEAARRDPEPSPACPGPFDAEVDVVTADVRLQGRLTVPEGAVGLVVFAHGSGSSRRSPRNRYVADVLNQAGVGTLLFDLLTVAEEGDRRNVFDIDLLAARLVDTTRWLRAQPAADGLPIAYFGASTGAAAAASAAAEPDAGVVAVVSRGGRPDLAASRLADVTAPTLLIVGGRDEVVLGLNRRARAELRCESELSVVPDATHLFEEPGALEAVARLARDWFLEHMSRPTSRAASHGSS